MQKNLPSLFITLCMCFCTFAFAQTVRAQDSSNVIRLERLLKESALSFTKIEDNVYVVNFDGKSLPKIAVIITSGTDFVTAFTITAKKKNLSLNPDMMHQLLLLNGSLDQVKIGFDKDGDLFVRTDFNLRTIDAQDLKAGVKQIAAATDEVYKAIKPFLTGP